MIKCAFISLGCAKNLVDSECILGLLKEHTIEIIDDISEADVCFINTCGFINSAKKEAIKTILQVSQVKKKKAKIIVVGCLAKRYKKELLESMKEIDLIIGVDEYPQIGKILNKFFKTNDFSATFDMKKRQLSNPLPTAYLKIGEGCSNKCAYCAIPLIRGEYVSYSKESIIEDAKRLIKLGKKEIVVIAQDPTRYGKDLYDDYALEDLMEDLLNLDESVNYRVLYLYPDRITDRLINIFKERKNLLPYFDIPIQHSSNKMLEKMKRSGTKEKYIKVIEKIKKEVPNYVLRTTLIVGFPGESEEDFNDMYDFIKQIEFDHLGAFVYSKEEDTEGYYMKDQVSKKVAKERLNKIMQLQQKISYKKNQRYLGQIIDVTIENADRNYYYGRSYMFAPDDIDGYVKIKNVKILYVGDTYKVKVVEALNYDLIGEVVYGNN